MLIGRGSADADRVGFAETPAHPTLPPPTMSTTAIEALYIFNQNR